MLSFTGQAQRKVSVAPQRRKLLSLASLLALNLAGVALDLLHGELTLPGQLSFFLFR
jgi:hypothetical protein